MRTDGSEVSSPNDMGFWDKIEADMLVARRDTVNIPSILNDLRKELMFVVMKLNGGGWR